MDWASLVETQNAKIPIFFFSPLPRHILTTSHPGGPDDILCSMSSTRKKFGNRYPWDVWFRRGVLVLKRGKDFAGRADTMAQVVRRAAERDPEVMGVSIRLAQDGSSITIRVTRCPDA